MVSSGVVVWVVAGLVMGVVVDILMNLDAFLVHSNVSQLGIGPTAGVVVVDAVLFAVHRFMCMPAENPVCALEARMQQRTRTYFFRKPEPTCIRPVRKPSKRLALQVQLLQNQVQ